MIPIWKDTELSASNTGRAVYTRIRKGGADGEVIFHGRVADPGGAVLMNGVCADHLRVPLPLLDEVEEFTVHNPVAFTLEISATGAAWLTKGTVEFYPNWSYDWEFTERARPLTMAPSGEAVPGQYLFVTVMAEPGTAPAATSLTLTGTRKDGTAYTREVAVPAGALIGTGVFTLPEFASPGDVLEVAGLTFRVAENCTRYVLYWVNDYGGWEQMPVRNGAPQADSVTRHTVQTGRLNTYGGNGAARAEREYANVTERTVRLGTGWLDDRGSALMRGLFNSTDILLFDTQATSEAGRFIPLVLTDDAVEYKTFKGNGGQMVRYDFEARMALNFVRR